MTDFVKRNPAAPTGFFAWEATGLQWLADVEGAVPCAQVVSFDATSLTLRRLDSAIPSPEAAFVFGSRLAVTHDAGAAGFGAGPDGYDGPGFFGPLSQPLSMSLRPHRRWGEFYADERLTPMAELAGARLDAATRAAVDSVASRCRTGDFDDDDPPARLHGDLWSGNLMWTRDGVVLIDPAAHGGHRETDLAMLELFGCPHYDAILTGYQRVRSLRPGWRKRIGLHQLFPLASPRRAVRRRVRATGASSRVYSRSVNGAQALINALVDGGVDVCFANPGTSEMHFVAALDTVPRMRGVLTLFEGVATGAADGYARIADRPAAVLLHLGPGLGNGLANLHNARRAKVPMVVVVGDHATYHKKYDAPLESDIEALAGSVSGWLRRSDDDVAADAAEAIVASQRGGQVATLILPADISWTDGARTGQSAPARPAPTVDMDAVQLAAKVLQSDEPAVILVGGDATRSAGLAAAARVATATGVRWYCEVFPTRLERGAGVPAVERIAYFAEAVAAQLDGAKHLILAGAASPVSFFAYPGKPSDLVPEGCHVHVLAEHTGAAAALAALADEVAPGTTAAVVAPSRPHLPTGALTSAAVADAIGALMPERAIVVDESNTSGVPLAAATAGAPAHDWLTLTGGAIGFGIPSAVGAAVAAPDRPVLCLESDGSAMYTISGLWTQAREKLDVTTVIYNNGAYDILRIELQRVGAGSAPGPKALDLLDLSRPTMDFVKIAEGMGVPARRVSTAEDFVDALRAAFAEPGPHLIDAVVPSILG